MIDVAPLFGSFEACLMHKTETDSSDYSYTFTDAAPRYILNSTCPATPSALGPLGEASEHLRSPEV